MRILSSVTVSSLRKKEILINPLSHISYAESIETDKRPENNADALLPLLPLQQHCVTAEQLQLVHLVVTRYSYRISKAHSARLSQHRDESQHIVSGTPSECFLMDDDLLACYTKEACSARTGTSILKGRSMITKVFADLRP